MSDAFGRLVPFIREYIYNKNWTELKNAQAQAINAILDDERHILISSGTASGKTEAAFFPILSQIADCPPSSVAVLYIGPLKALINDQFERLRDLLKAADIKVWRWHGDVPAAHKKKLLENPSGILQITPESLESMMMRKGGDIIKLFRDLRYIVIDEVHAFMGIDRGSQLLCQIAKIERFAKCSPRRIGLSATLGEVSSAADWLCLGSDKSAIVIDDKNTKKKFRIAVNWHKEDLSFYTAIYNQCKDTKSIIFTNSRTEAEQVIANMREIARLRREPNVFYVHHGSISKRLREEAESAMREHEGSAVTSATLTLELGIDIGKLERVLQIGAPYSCAGFLQRLGRSGRKTGVSEMYFTGLEIESEYNGDDVFRKFPFELIKIIAIIQLYLEERWIEPIGHKPLPFSLLYHQTMSMLVSMGEMTVSALARSVLTFPPFYAVSQEDYRALLLHLLKIKHIQKTEENTLIVGLEAERAVNHFSFYAVFPEEDEVYKVIFDGREIGSINNLPPDNAGFCLAGRYWAAIDVDARTKCVFVKPAEKSRRLLWSLAGGGEIHTKIVRRMRQVLIEEDIYPYLFDSAKERLGEARNLAKNCEFIRSVLSEYCKNTFIFSPWLGSRGMRTLDVLFRKDGFFKNLRAVPIDKYFYAIKSDLPLQKLTEKFFDEIKNINSANELIGGIGDNLPLIDKYDRLLPKELLKKQYISNRLDAEELKF
ncbi:ATP-dependent helicase [Synergistales bacterium]|nr:ATP-dependent helicase [Synergistales bacterium]